MIKLFNFAFVVFLSFSLLGGCKSNSEHSIFRYLDFGPDGMVQNKEYLFDHFIDSINSPLINKPATLWLELRYTNNYPFRNLPLNIETYTSIDSIKKFYITIPLFDKKDRNKGNGNFGIYVTKVPIRDNVLIDEFFYLSLKTSEKNTQGIISAGLIIDNSIYNQNETNTR